MKRNNRKSMKTRIFAAFLAVLLLVGMIPTVSAAGTYNAGAALSYAERHWNDGVGLCAQFVSECLRAGGLSSYSKGATTLFRQLSASNVGTVVQLDTMTHNNMVFVKESNYGTKLSAGDPVFYYCNSCDDGKAYMIHVVLCRDVKDGFMRAYSHNRANSATNHYGYNLRCYDCGSAIDGVYAYHLAQAPAKQRHNVFTTWLSNDCQTGTTKASNIKVGEMIWMWYRMFDEYTGDLFNSYADLDYRVTQTFYAPDGEIESYTYENSDNNWFGYTPHMAGTHRYTVTISGDCSGFVSRTFEVSQELQRKSVMKTWITDASGRQTNCAKVGDKLVYHYKFFDEMTGEMLNSYYSGDYIATCSLLDSDGNVCATGDFKKQDAGEIYLNPEGEGNYTLTLELKGSLRGSSRTGICHKI